MENWDVWRKANYAFLAARADLNQCTRKRGPKPLKKAIWGGQFAVFTKNLDFSLLRSQVRMRSRWVLSFLENAIIIRCIFSFIFIGGELTTWPAYNCLQINNILLMRMKMEDRFPKQTESDLACLVDQKNGDRMISLRLRQIIDLLAIVKSEYFAQRYFFRRWGLSLRAQHWTMGMRKFVLGGAWEGRFFFVALKARMLSENVPQYHCVEIMQISQKSYRESACSVFHSPPDVGLFCDWN